MSDDVTVIQADREAAAANIKRRLVWQHGGEQPWMDASTMSMRMGEQDDHDEVIAFAKHRLSAPSPDSGERMREALDWALAEIEGRTRYNPDYYTGKEQREDALAKARAALQESAR